MGWGSGVEVAEEIWDGLKKHIPKEKRKVVAQIIVEAVENHDCDTICDSEELCKLAHNHKEDE